MINGSPYDEKNFNPNIWLKGVAVEWGVPAKDLMVLAFTNEPFVKGTPAHWQQAKWFKHQYDKYGHKDMHLRRLHYRMVNAGEAVLLWDGSPYENDKKSWQKLVEAFGPARILGLVDAYDFTENRVKDPRHEGMSVFGTRKKPVSR